MCAILQLVSAPLNPIPIAEHFRRSHPQCEHSCEQHIYMSKENNAKQNEDVIQRTKYTRQLNEQIMHAHKIKLRAHAYLDTTKNNPSNK